VVLPLVVVVGFQSAWAAYVCRADGQRAHPCCKEKRNAADDGIPRITAQTCCKVTVHLLNDATPARESDRVSFSYAPPIAALISLPIVAPRVERVVSIAALARPPPRGALYLDNQALLR